MTELWDGTGVTPAALKAEVIRLAEENPEQTAVCIYTKSHWNDDGVEVFTQPECIVGTAVFNITGKLVGPKFEGYSVTGSVWYKALGGPFYQSDDILFVKRVQGYQDGGNSWGAALRGAMNNY